MSDLTLLASKTVSMACVHVLEVAMPTNIDVCPNMFGNMSDMCAQRFFSAIQTGVEAKLFLWYIKWTGSQGPEATFHDIMV